jgi:hypothetical protein
MPFSHTPREKGISEIVVMTPVKLDREISLFLGISETFHLVISEAKEFSKFGFEGIGVDINEMFRLVLRH